ncbi:hypothetical protein Tco_0091630 [Tanacetum coccineum]
MAIAEDEPSVGKADARSVIRVNLENESLKDEIFDLKKVIEKWTCSKVTLDQLLSEQVPGNIVKALGGRGKRKDKISSKEEPLPPLPKLIGVAPAGTLDSLILLSDLTLNMADLTLNTYVPKKTKPTSVKVSPAYVIKKKTENKSPAVLESCSNKKADSSTEQLLLTLMEEESGPKVVFGDDSSGDTEGYGSVNCNEITFTRVAYVNGLKHNIISISQLCDMNTQGIPGYFTSRRRVIADCIMSFIRKMENLNEVKVKELRSDNEQSVNLQSGKVVVVGKKQKVRRRIRQEVEEEEEEELEQHFLESLHRKMAEHHFELLSSKVVKTSIAEVLTIIPQTQKAKLREAYKNKIVSRKPEQSLGVRPTIICWKYRFNVSFSFAFMYVGERLYKVVGSTL